MKYNIHEAKTPFPKIVAAVEAGEGHHHLPQW